MIITAVHVMALRVVPNCDGSLQNLWAALLMYTAYMLLFLQFFVGRYLTRKKGKGE
jgi:hypothetical protein